jgi:hypothetical protein
MSETDATVENRELEKISVYNIDTFAGVPKVRVRTKRFEVNMMSGRMALGVFLIDKGTHEQKATRV